MIAPSKSGFRPRKADFGRFWAQTRQKWILSQKSTFLARKPLLARAIIDQESSPESAESDESSETCRRSFLVFFRENIDGLVKGVRNLLCRPTHP